MEYDYSTQILKNIGADGFFSEIRYRNIGTAILDNKPHTHDDCFEIIQCFNNDGNIVIKDRIYPMMTGSVYVINAINVHKSAPKNPKTYTRSLIQFKSSQTENILCSMNAEQIIDDMFIKNGGCYIALPSHASAYVDSCIKRIYDLGRAEEQNGTENAPLLSLIISLIVELWAQYRENSVEISGDSAVNNIMRYINENLGNTLTLDIIARAMYMSKYYLCRIFKEQLNMTISQYILARRLSWAKKQLLYSDSRISDIAMFSGFGSTAYFSYLFRKYESVTPGEYRALNRNGTEK